MENNGLYKTLVDFDDVPEDAFIVDVRNGNEHSDVSLKRKHYFVELPRFDAAEFLKEHSPEGKTIYVLCQSGKRASVAAQRLEEAGYENVAVIRGGMGALSNRPEVVRKRAAISLERQVRIIAGSLVLAAASRRWFSARPRPCCPLLSDADCFTPASAIRAPWQHCCQKCLGTNVLTAERIFDDKERRH